MLPCNSISCRYGARCRFTRGYPECTCPVESECPVDVKPVCGSDGKNYPNECVMTARACLMRKDVTAAYDGICGTKILRIYFVFRFCFLFHLFYILCKHSLGKHFLQLSLTLWEERGEFLIDGVYVCPKHFIVTVVRSI